ncbi:MAG: PxxKW family cysteine-rich protein, partial [Thermodesulfobacteriota bacterium]
VKEYSSGKFCASYPQPEIKWRDGKCNFATHIKEESQKAGKKVNALKASKRKASGKM